MRRPIIEPMDRSDERIATDSTEIVPGIEPLEPRSTRTSPTRQRMRRRTGAGDHALDEKIRALVEEAPFDVADPDLLQQAVETMFRTARTANRGEMKLVSR